MAVLFAVLAMMVRNVVVNLAAIGKEFSFGFLFTPAGYDITFSPFIEYTSRSTHLRAATVGVFNTLLVAASGIVLATIMGFILGIVRLSSNWIANRIVYVFIEFARNVPVLLHIFFVYGLVVILLPAPKKAPSIWDLFYLSNRGFFVPSPVFESAMWIVAVVLAAAIIFTIFFKRWAKQVQNRTGHRYPVFWISSGAIIGATAIAFIAAGMPLTWEIPVLKGFNYKGGMSIKPEFIALWFALSYYTSCFIAEIVRGGILAVSKGQTEAAYAVGMRPNRTLQLIIIPQALRVIVPPLASQYLNLTKNSSLAIAIGYMDITATIGGITLMQTGKEMETMLIVMCCYLVFSLTISALMNWFNRSIKLKER